MSHTTNFSPKAVKKHLKYTKRRIHVIVTDMRMPEMTGLELLRIAKKEYPHIIGLVLSGYGDTAALQAAVEQGEIFKRIPKPWKLGKFERLIRQALIHSNLRIKCNTVKL